ncbi:hypothetical protein [Heyndrickxia oleronia]|uniref:hypothetical protein n=1 Tax=Heyndrickxia oleronia TaxID=38875 RepID=UPI001FEFB285|nr:hypothetical protein [Heyndrickxia oleronia]
MYSGFVTSEKLAAELAIGATADATNAAVAVVANTLRDFLAMFVFPPFFYTT